MIRDDNLIAVGVDEEGKIFKAHFGMSPYYLVFNRDGDLVRKIENPYAKGHHHDDPSLITTLLPDVKVFIAHRMGPKSRERLHKEFKIKTFLTETKDPKKALSEFLSTDNS